MDFQHTEEQRLLADSVGRLLERSYGFEARKAIVSSSDGFSAAVWRDLASMGLLSVPFAAEDGGFGGGAIDLVAPMQALGAALLVEPFASTLAPAGRLVALLGTSAQRAALVPRIVDGSAKLAFAHLETLLGRSLDAVATTATPVAGGGWRLAGEKRMVLHAPMADALVVTARIADGPGHDDGVGAFVVDARRSGVSMKTFRTVDDLRAADVAFRDVALEGDARLGDGRDARAAIEEAVDFAAALGCAEAVGALDSANQATLEYLKTRRQFGVPIGSFQALQHRMVDMTIHAEQARSITLLACAKVDAAARGEIDAAERARIVSAAKVLVGTACRHVGQEAIQLHGGMGMTVEMKISHTFKRLTMLAQQFGDVDHHLERFATADAAAASAAALQAKSAL
ncbi:MAG: pimeloyl-CoA dehydrogenase small subunit [Burkholderiales bacterium]|nr:MAG: pimeloyl-CoA dehydrogenase small subunit [Burkholderiales bacterium]